MTHDASTVMVMQTAQNRCVRLSSEFGASAARLEQLLAPSSPAYGPTSRGASVTALVLDGPLPGACADRSVVLAGDVPFPFAIAVGGIEIATEGEVVAIDRTRDVTITWMHEPGAVDLFEVKLHEVREVGGSTELVNLRQIRTRRPRITIPNELLASSHHYLLTVASIVATPNSSNGDYATVAYPFATTILSSPLFTVE